MFLTTRRFVNRVFFLLLGLIAAGFGFWSGKGGFSREKERELAAVYPERSFPVTKQQQFTFVVYASNQAAWLERCLNSIFSQDYDSYRVIFIDDASSDETHFLAQNFVMNAAQDERVILMRNEKKLGPAASLYLASEHCLDQEVIIPLEAKDWLVQEDILLRLNQAFQNPDVWIARSAALSYPEFQRTDLGGLFAFYAALLKEVPIAEFFSESGTSAVKEVYISPIRELAGKRLKTFAEPFVFTNHAGRFPQKEPALLSRRLPQKTLREFPSASPLETKADLLVFSYDRPLQLYAFLESLSRYLTGVSSISVIYRASDERFSRAYQEVQKAFPSARWMIQSDRPHKDFKPLVLDAIKKGSSQYLIFAVDDIIVKDFVDLSRCIQMMEKTKAYGFYLRLGLHVNYCYMADAPQKIPPHIPLESGVLAWDFSNAERDWAFANTLDMTLYRKADFLPLLEKIAFKHPDRLEQSWASHQQVCHTIGLCFESSKIVNLPLNLVNPSNCRHSGFMTTEELLVKWTEGMKIDIEPLFQIENLSAHIDYTPTFVGR